MTVVDGDAATLTRHVDNHLAMTSDRGTRRLDYVQAETSGDGGVDGVSAALEDVDADLRRDRVSGCYGTVFD